MRLGLRLRVRMGLGSGLGWGLFALIGCAGARMALESSAIDSLHMVNSISDCIICRSFVVHGVLHFILPYLPIVCRRDASR